MSNRTLHILTPTDFPTLSMPMEHNLTEIKENVSRRLNLSPSEFSLWDGQKLVAECLENCRNTDMFLTLKFVGLVGGKGGFGSLLRNMKSTVITTNYGACRDAKTGRRMREVSNEERMAKWEAGAEERKKKRDERKKEMMEDKKQKLEEAIDRKSYMKQRNEVVNDVLEALEVAKELVEEIEEEKEVKLFTAYGWDDSSSDSESEDSEEQEDNGKKRKRSDDEPQQQPETKKKRKLDDE